MSNKSNNNWKNIYSDVYTFPLAIILILISCVVPPVALVALSVTFLYFFTKKKEPRNDNETTYTMPDTQTTPNLMYISAKAKAKYLKSNDWLQLKWIALEIANNKCEVCGCTHSLQLHHQTYIRLTKEEIEDVRIVCAKCHNKIHNKLGKDRATFYPISILK